MQYLPRAYNLIELRDFYKENAHYLKCQTTGSRFVFDNIVTGQGDKLSEFFSTFKEEPLKDVPFGEQVLYAERLISIINQELDMIVKPVRVEDVVLKLEWVNEPLNPWSAKVDKLLLIATRDKTE